MDARNLLRAACPADDDARILSFCSAVAADVIINSGRQNGQICAVVRTGQGSETSSSAE
jgi:hypothetical protein